jgi:putative membrane protein
MTSRTKRDQAASGAVGARIPDGRKASEHLANERTFLAWVRTSIAIMSLGFVVAKFGLWLRELASRLAPRTPAHGSGFSGPVGMGMIAFGGALALLAAWRFHTVNRQIERGRVSVDRGLVGLVSITMAALAVLLMAYIGLTTT